MALSEFHLQLHFLFISQSTKSSVVFFAHGCVHLIQKPFFLKEKERK